MTAVRDSRVGPAVGARRRTSQRFPVRHIYCVGRNYAEHAKEMGGDATKEPPFFFTKPADAIVPVVPPAVGRIPYPMATKNSTTRSSWSSRSATSGAKVAPERAQALICGYAVGLDMTRRDLQNEMREKKRPWDIGKSFAQAAPIAPIHPAAADRAADARRDQARRQRQRPAAAAISRDMIWDVPHMLAFLSQLLRAAARRPDLHRHARRRGRGRRRRPSRRQHRRPDAARDRNRRGVGLTWRYARNDARSRRARLQQSRGRSRSSALARQFADVLARRGRARFAEARPALRHRAEGDARPVPAGRRARGTLLFIHGGYWRALDKDDHSFVAPAFVDAGFAVAVVNYDLCPDVTIATIVDECRRAVAWVAARRRQHGAAAPLVIAGHSAGGHLAAMMFATDWRAHGFARAVRRRRLVSAACTTSRRSCCSRTTPTSGSTTPARARIADQLSPRPTRRCSSPSAPTRRPNSCANRSCCGTRGRHMPPAKRRAAVRRRAPSLQRRARLRRSRKRAHAAKRWRCWTAHAASADSIGVPAGAAECAGTDAPLR